MVAAVAHQLVEASLAGPGQPADGPGVGGDGLELAAAFRPAPGASEDLLGLATAKGDGVVELAASAVAPEDPERIPLPAGPRPPHVRVAVPPARAGVAREVGLDLGGQRRPSAGPAHG